jgi:hypothetical protein
VDRGRVGAEFRGGSWPHGSSSFKIFVDLNRYVVTLPWARRKGRLRNRMGTARYLRVRL